MCVHTLARFMSAGEEFTQQHPTQGNAKKPHRLRTTGNPPPNPPSSGTGPTGWDMQGVLAWGHTHPQTLCNPCSSMPSISSYVAMFSPSLRMQSEKPW